MRFLLTTVTQRSCGHTPFKQEVSSQRQCNLDEEGKGAAAACQKSQNPLVACFPPTVAGLRPLPWEKGAAEKVVFAKRPPNKWLRFALTTALLQREQLRLSAGRGHHQNCTRQLGHGLTSPGDSNQSCSGPKAALEFSAPCKPVPKAWSWAMLCYQRPYCPSPCCPTSVTARNLLSKRFVGHCQPPRSWL